MGIAGGVCLLFIYCIGKFCPDIPLWFRCVVGAVLICTVEFTIGFAVNILLEWNIWDYSDRWLNVYGQICPMYAFLWFGLCFPGYMISLKLKNIFCSSKGDTNKFEREV